MSAGFQLATVEGSYPPEFIARHSKGWFRNRGRSSMAAGRDILLTMRNKCRQALAVDMLMQRGFADNLYGLSGKPVNRQMANTRSVRLVVDRLDYLFSGAQSSYKVNVGKDFKRRYASLMDIKKSFAALSIKGSISSQLGIVVKGGNKGNGLKICRQLASNDIKVILTARNESRGIETIEKLKVNGPLDAVFHQLDVKDPSSIARLAKYVESQLKKT
ncbi:broad substrate reductase/dehydrogenase [Artemisia annua]|uniref:Broad substrate reductase/dehydrogenase n=1 Tax=Artemisia annua TaxID=35608 RepID=A0A2U1QJC1_ARTAN|nr:broad substrate reductase/dehydrogenase [Artemisia annua]